MTKISVGFLRQIYGWYIKTGHVNSFTLPVKETVLGSQPVKRYVSKVI
jgi:hypothetical protein